MSDLKKVYQASSREIAENYLLELEEKWREKYPLVIKSWQNNWENLLRGYIDRSENSLKPRAHLPAQMPCTNRYIVL